MAGLGARSSRRNSCFLEEIGGQLNSRQHGLDEVRVSAPEPSKLVDRAGCRQARVTDLSGFRGFSRSSCPSASGPTPINRQPVSDAFIMIEVASTAPGPLIFLASDPIAMSPCGEEDVCLVS